MEDRELIGLSERIQIALSKIAGHTVSLTVAQEMFPDFRIFQSRTDEGGHALVMVRGSKIQIIPLDEDPKKVFWDIRIMYHPPVAFEVEMVFPLVEEVGEMFG